MWKGYLADVFNERYRGGTSDSTGIVTHSLGPVPEGYCWYLSNSTLHSTTQQPTATFEIYASSANQRPTDGTKSGRQDFTSGANVQDSANNYSSPLYFGPGQFVVFVWTGLSSGDLVSWSGQIHSHKLEVHQVRQHGLAQEQDGKVPHAVVTPDQFSAV